MSSYSSGLMPSEAISSGENGDSEMTDMETRYKPQALF